VGGLGSNGGTSGTGGWGETGGNGAGGTIKLLCSAAIGTAGVSVDATGGTIAGPVPGGNGRFIFGCNDSASFGGSVTGATVTNTIGPLRLILPHGAYPAPFIPNLPLGPEAFGRTPFAANVDFPAVIAQVPPGARMAILKLGVGPKPLNHAFKGYEYLLVMNASAFPLLRPKLAVASGGFPLFAKVAGEASGHSVAVGAGAPGLPSMADGGPANDPAFGGSGPQPLPYLEPWGVYVALVPEGTVDVEVEFGVGNGIVRQLLGGIGTDQTVFVTAAAVGASAIPAVHPAGLALLALLVGLAAMQLRRRT